MFALEQQHAPDAVFFERIDNLADERYAEVFGFPVLGRAAYGGFKVRF